MKAILLAALALTLSAGCAESSTPSSQDSDFTTAVTPAGSEVPAFTAADSISDFGARVRVSFAGGPVKESAESTAFGGTLNPDLPLPWSLGIGVSPANAPVFLYFGGLHGQLAVGTYSCADGDAMVFEAFWNSDGSAKPAHEASACSFSIDQILPAKSGDYVRVYGHFAASAAGPDGLSTDLKGTFGGDFHKPVATAGDAGAP